MKTIYSFLTGALTVCVVWFWIDTSFYEMAPWKGTTGFLLTSAWALALSNILAGPIGNLLGPSGDPGSR